MRVSKLSSVIIAIALAIVPQAAAAAISSEATVWSPLTTFPDQTEGGWDVPVVEVSGFAEWTLPILDYTQGYSGLSRASAEAGQLTGNMVVTVSVDPEAPANRLGGAGGINLRFRDDFSITAGTSGLSDGDPVQVRLQVRIQGSVKIGGNPAGGSSLSVSVLNNVPTAPRIDYGTGGLNPPQDFGVDEYHELIIDTEIGSVVRIDSQMVGTMNGTSWAPGTVAESYMVFTHQARISHAAGFENIDISSLAGAPVAPLRPPGDADSDGIPDTTDNCIVTANATQFDSNGDNYGNACDPDLDNDCLINFGDLAEFRAAFFPRPYVVDADFDGDGFVNFGDLAVVREFFLASPGPTNLTNACDPAPFTGGAFTAAAAGWFDLDLGMNTANGDAPSDIHWRVVTAHDAMLRPINGARLVVMGPVMPSYTDCVAAPMSTVDISLWHADVGSWMCAETDEGRRVRFQIIGSDVAELARATQMNIAFTTW